MRGTRTIRSLRNTLQSKYGLKLSRVNVAIVNELHWLQAFKDSVLNLILGNEIPSVRHKLNLVGQ